MATTTVSLSILAGLTFGFLYLLISGIKWASERLEGGAGIVGKDRCARCGVTFVDVEDGTCSMCGLTVCTHCALHYQHSWLCTACVIKTDETLNSSEWVLSHFKKRFQSTVAVMRKYGSLRGNPYFRTLIGARFVSSSRRKSGAFLFSDPRRRTDCSVVPRRQSFVISDHSGERLDL
ncbi:hypothetical protein GE061_001400 [Apolygus lucorum]|uniref:Uncharacterized protein n=1 Tax=Apolygus lucorum TaxID=248454 RepID=A0A8S9Y6X9_APOLU|nr:hypothetical protein GE061_001400 [Apolygus lucorum]